MTSDQEKNIVRFTLQSYIGPSVGSIEISQRQKDAIQRLLYLPDRNFIELCDDIVNEIHRRNGMKHKTSSSLMFNKLINLSNEKFKNLVVDTLLVYNYRNPGSECSNEEFMKNLKDLIDELKSSPENDNFIEKIKNLSFTSKISEYNKYIRRNGEIDKAVVEEMDSIIKEEVESKYVNMFECLSFPKVFIEKLDQTDIAQTEEYIFHRNNICRMLDECFIEDGPKENSGEKQSVSFASRSKIIKSEMMQVIGMLVSKINIPTKNIEPFHDEICTIIDILKSLKLDMTGGRKIDIDFVSSAVDYVVDALLKKTSKIVYLDNDLVNDLKMQKILIGELQLSATKLDAVKLIIDLAKNLQKIIQNIK